MTTLTTDLETPRISEVPVATLLLHGALQFMGVALCVAALGIWITTRSDVMPATSLIKLGLSCFMGMGGLSCLMMARGFCRPSPQDPT
ncbi:MAG: hypothetical protein N4A53_13775 [Pelagimonas sp.]|jgi:hypothetical protein|nr:hypothetical protein [Pelagimonas sp.]